MVNGDLFGFAKWSFLNEEEDDSSEWIDLTKAVDAQGYQARDGQHLPIHVKEGGDPGAAPATDSRRNSQPWLPGL